MLMKTFTTIVLILICLNAFGQKTDFSGETNEFYVDWNSFAWGFCCCPVGFFTVAVNNNSDSDMKTSYWIGAASCVSLFAIIGTVSISFNYNCYY